MTATAVAVETRETWLQLLVAECRPVFADAGHELPPVRISVGFTSKGARSNRIGECWYGGATNDGVPQLFLHPKLATAEDVAHVVVHELCHAALGPEAKHGPAFKRLATHLGLGGRMTATVATPVLDAWLGPVLARTGAYPHAALVAGGSGTSTGPKQTTRMLKVQCPEDGYVARVARSWLDIGAPTCPCGTPLEEA